MPQFRMYECSAPTCRLRFPWTPNDPPLQRCPLCGGKLVVALSHDYAQSETSHITTPQASESPLHALLDNVRSTFNVGSIFRSADGAGLQQLYLCGITPTPDHPKLAKTALGAERSVAWSQHRNALDLAETLQAQGYQLWALEATPTALPLKSAPPLSANGVVLVVGNEVTGVDPALLARCDQVLALPMDGQKRSLNVAVAFGIATYTLRFLR